MGAVRNVIKDNYNMMLLKDYLREQIKDAGFSHAEISCATNSTCVNTLFFGVALPIALGVNLFTITPLCTVAVVGDDDQIW